MKGERNFIHYFKEMLANQIYPNRFPSSSSVSMEMIVFPSGVRLESGQENKVAIR